MWSPGAGFIPIISTKGINQMKKGNIISTKIPYCLVGRKKKILSYIYWSTSNSLIFIQSFTYICINIWIMESLMWKTDMSSKSINSVLYIVLYIYSNLIYVLFRMNWMIFDHINIRLLRAVETGQCLTFRDVVLLIMC